MDFCASRGDSKELSPGPLFRGARNVVTRTGSKSGTVVTRTRYETVARRAPTEISARNSRRIISPRRMPRLWRLTKGFLHPFLINSMVFTIARLLAGNSGRPRGYFESKWTVESAYDPAEVVRALAKRSRWA